MRRSRTVVLVSGGALALAALALLLQRNGQASFATREVIPRAVYSSGQPGTGDLADVAATLGVRAVINLRGPRTGEEWYEAELAASRSLGLTHEDVRIKTDDWPPQHEVRRFVALLEGLAQPVLLHCRSGVDRSGWAGAAVRCLAGEPLERALELLSPAAGHICLPARCPLHRFFALYEGWLARQGVSHTAETFRGWAQEEYCPEPYDAHLAWHEGPPAGVVAAGATVVLSVRVTNRSLEAWQLSSRTDRGIRLGVRALGPFQELPADPLGILRTPNNPARDLARAGMEDDQIPPGDSRVFSVRFPAPPDPGRYALQVDMVDERVHWFSDLGGAGILIPLEVRPR